MLKQKNRLSRIAKRASGEKFSFPLLNIQITENSGGDPRFAFIVSKKIDKRAVVRNRTKRVLRKTAESFLDNLKGKDIIVVAKKKLSFDDLEEVLKEFRKVIKKD